MCHFNGNNPIHCSIIGEVGFITYDKDNETISMKKHVSSCHLHELKKWNVMVEATKSFESVHPTCKRKTHPTPSSITSFFNYENGPIQWALLENLTLYIAKGHHPLLIIEDLWLKQLVLRPRGMVVFPSKHQLLDDVLPTTITNTMEKFLNLVFVECLICMAIFCLCMLQSGNDIFSLVIFFINANCSHVMRQLGYSLLKVVWVLQWLNK
jgi:hypothetical protein